MNSVQFARDDDAAFIERLRRDDQRAWRMFFSQHCDRIYRFCYSMLRNREDAEDASQEVLKRVVNGLGAFRGDASVSTWVHQIARNVCLNHIDSAKRSGKRVDPPEDLEADEIPPDRSAASHQQRVAIARAMAALDPVFRIAIYLPELEGLSYAEIAVIEKIPVETVKTRIYRARVELQRSLAEHRP